MLNTRGNLIANHSRLAKQRRISSFIEAVGNVAAGLLVATAAQRVVFPWFDIFVSWTDTWLIAAIMTGISVPRSYVVRRVFEWLRVSGWLP